jgi:hypothetical protein
VADLLNGSIGTRSDTADSVGNRKETDYGINFNTSRALLRSGRPLEQVKYKEITSENIYAFIKYHFGISYLKICIRI